jgi:hypothetical protein
VDIVVYKPKAMEKQKPGVGPFDKDPDDDIPFRGFDEDPEQ